MPRFYFNLHDDFDIQDPEGKELPDIEAAEAFGIQNARAIAAAQVESGKLELWLCIEISDPSGKVMKAITFSDAVKIEHR